MDRLTKRDEYGNADIAGVESEDLQLNLKFEELNKVTDALNKLAHYEDLAEQGRLVELPCAVGDTVWIPYLSKVIEKQVFSIVVQKAFYAVYTVYCDGTSLRFSEEDFGKTVFLTREEAEAKLAEEGGTNDE